MGGQKSGFSCGFDFAQSVLRQGLDRHTAAGRIGSEILCMNNLSGDAAGLKLYAYGADGTLAEVSNELWTITDEAGTGVDTLADGTLYELRVSIADGGALDLSEEEKEIIISVVLAK